MLDVRLEATQQKRAQHLSLQRTQTVSGKTGTLLLFACSTYRVQLFNGLLVCLALLKHVVKDSRVLEHVREQKIEQRPQLVQVVL